MWAYRPTASVATAHPIQATAAAPVIDQADHPRAVAASSVMWADRPFVLYSQGADVVIWANKPVASALLFSSTSLLTLWLMLIPEWRHIGLQHLPLLFYQPGCWP